MSARAGRPIEDVMEQNHFFTLSVVLRPSGLSQFIHKINGPYSTEGNFNFAEG